MILIGGGMFLIAKATREIHNEVELRGHDAPAAVVSQSFFWVVMQLIAIDLVFSLDSIITAIGMVRDIEVMIAAVGIAMIVMYVASGPVSEFITRHPTTKMLALAFLVLIGVALVADGFEVHIPRGYIYFAMAFAAAVEGINVVAGRNRRRARARARAETLMPKRPLLLITGAGRGIGAATAQLAAARGFDVAVNYKSNPDAAAKVVAAAQAAGARAIAVAADMARESEIERMFKTVDEELGPLTHFVYNCGITGRASRLDAADPAMMREVVEINVLGALIALRHAIARISTKHGGSGGAMVLISSRAATLGAPNEYVWYAASKGAIEALTIGLSLELTAGWYPRQCGLPRHDCDADPCRRRHAGPTGKARTAHPDGSSRPAGGSGGGRAVPAVGRRLLHQWHDPARLGRPLNPSPACGGG